MSGSTEEAPEALFAAAREEIARIERLFDAVPSLKRKWQLLRDLLAAYGAPEALPPKAVYLGAKTVANLEKSRTDDTASRQSTPRPPGIPSNFMMTHDVLTGAEPDGMVATLLVEKIRERWWPGVAFNTIGPEFYRYIKEGRLSRDHDGCLRLTDKGRETAKSPGGFRVPKSKVEAQPPPKRLGQPVKKELSETRLQQLRAAAQANAANDEAAKPMMFERGADMVPLDPPHWRIADYLFQHMGEGCIGDEKLAEISKAKGITSSRNYVTDAVTTINGKIGVLKLQIVPYEKIGFFMRETA